MDTDKLADAKEFILTAMGETGMDETEMQTGIELMGYEFTAVTMKGKAFCRYAGRYNFSKRKESNT